MPPLMTGSGFRSDPAGADGDHITVLGETVELDVAAHTRVVAFFVPNPEGADIGPLLFCGDTLFSGGCGRLFGSAEQMHQALNKLAKLPDETKVCCAHEYTTNLRWAVERSGRHGSG